MKKFDEIRTQKVFPELLLEREISSVIKQEGRVSNPTISPSGLGCPRGAAFKLSGAVMEDSEETYESGIAAAMGTFIHERIQKFLSTSDIWVDVKDYIEENPQLGLSIAEKQKSAGEVSLVFSGYRNGKKVTPPFSFQCDGIVKIEGEYYIVEIKSESDRVWQNRTEPNPKHRNQAISYSFLYGIDKILWVYASRESYGANRKVYLQKIDEREVETFLLECSRIGEAVEMGEIKYLPKSKDCKWCAYLKECKKLDG